MAIDIHILGTASARPTNERKVSGSIVKCEDGIIVIDAGEGFQMRYSEHRKYLKNSENPVSLKSNAIDAICLTHGHLDHTWGVLPWLQTMSLDRRERPIAVYGPTSSEVFDALLAGQEIPQSADPSDLARQWKSWHSLGGTSEYLSYPVSWYLLDTVGGRCLQWVPEENRVVELEQMPQPQGWKKCQLTPVTTVHSVPSCAWMVSQQGKQGKFNRMRALELKLSEEQSIALAQGQSIQHNGEQLEASQFRSAPQPDLRVVLSGDTSEMAPGLCALDGVDILVHESTFLNDAQKWADEFQHSTASGSARTALACKASNLVLTHYSARIKNLSASVREASEVIGEQCSVYAAQDGDYFRLDDSASCSHYRKN